jgi:DMSO reductase anchor subunit
VSDLIRNIIRLFLFIFVQVYILDKIPTLHQYITPYLYFLFILWIPFSVSRIGLLFIGFVTGMALDYFTNTPGLHAAPCVLIAYLRPFIINILSPKDSAEFNYREPSPRSMGWTPYLVYVLVLTVFHHLYLVILEWMSFPGFLHMLIKVLSTTAISLLLIIVTELLFSRKMNYRTNTA